MKIGIFCYLIADILTKVLQKCSLRGPLQNIPFLLSFNLAGYHGNQKAKFAKKKKKKKKTKKTKKTLAPQKLFGGKKLKLCRIVSNNSLYKKVFLLTLVKHFCCYGNLKFRLTYNGKSEN